MTDQNQCPICRNIPLWTGASGDNLQVDCPQCGKFVASGPTLAQISSLMPRDNRRAAVVSYCLRELQSSEERPRVTPDLLNEFLANRQLPSPPAQADNLIRWLGKNSDAGKIVDVSVLPHGAIIGAPTLDAFHLVLKSLQERRLFKWYAVMGADQDVEMTMSGWERFEVMASQTPAAHGHKLVAVLATDIVGYSEQVAANEQSALAARNNSMNALRKAVQTNGGRLVKTTGDGALSEFPSVLGAMKAALEIQRDAVRVANTLPEGKGLRLRIGLAVGDVVAEGTDILGHAVNLAARLEGIAAPGAVCTTEQIRDDLANKLTISWEVMGPRSLKNIPREVRVVMAYP